MSASNDGRPEPGGRADDPRGRGKIRRSGLRQPQLGTDAEAENGGVRADADYLRAFLYYVDCARWVPTADGGEPAVTLRLASHLDTFSGRSRPIGRWKRATGSSKAYV